MKLQELTNDHDGWSHYILRITEGDPPALLTRLMEEIHKRCGEAEPTYRKAPCVELDTAWGDDTPSYVATARFFIPRPRGEE